MRGRNIKLQDLLPGTNKAIQSIYMYAKDTNRIYHANSIIAADTFSDAYWLDLLNPDKYGISIFPYASYNAYPYTICVAKEFEANGHEAVICFMLNLARIPLLQETSDGAPKFFIVSDNQEVIYYNKQRALLSDITDFDVLTHYDSTVSSKSDIYDSASPLPYSLSQSHSPDYPWTYVMYTPLQDYVSRLSNTRVITLSIFALFVTLFAMVTVYFLLQAVKPLRKLRNLLEKADLLSSADTASTAGIDYIAGKITQYVQTNKHLAARFSLNPERISA